ncbi:hypothetical protein [Amycolatopsis sp. NPDC004079]|uniref:hypothetical protein n=1 Tax=Amycolatopsis sp. NPDC004079 TaxID=3154549 RepID=UPI0033B2DE32
MSLLLVFAVFLGTVEPAAAAQGATKTVAVRSPARPIPKTDYPGWDGKTGVGKEIDPRYRGLVADIAELSEEPEVREAAAVALAANTDEAIRTFLDVGESEAQARAKARREDTARRDRAAVLALKGTGGPVFNAEVERVLAGSDADRAAFLDYGRGIAQDRDRRAAASAQARAAELRTRVQALTGAGGPEVRQAAQAALAAGDAAIVAFLDGGYLAAAKRDAEAREAYLKDLEAREKAADQLSELAKKTARANAARRNLLIANGQGVRTLEQASNAMVSAGNAARQAAQILAANAASGQHSPSSFSLVVREADRQLGYANQAVTDAQNAAAAAEAEAGILVDTGLTYGTQWAQLARGAAEAARAAAGAAQTARQAIDATMATDAARNDQDKAEKHAAEAQVWRVHAEEHARATAVIAESARLQSAAAKDAAARAHEARAGAEQADQQAQAGAQRTHDARLTAEAEQRGAANSRRIAETERANAAAWRQQADSDTATACAARGQADTQARYAAEADRRAHEQERISADAATAAQNEERNSATARDAAIAAEQRKDTTEARAQAFEQAAAAARGTEHAARADQAARQARLDANAAAAAAVNARDAANLATGAAARARQAATEATRAAARARAAAEDAKAHAAQANAAAGRAESAAADTRVSAATADVKAAEATAAEVQAGVHARAAVELAERSADEAVRSARGADRTGAESNAAFAEAVSAATQAGFAVQAALAARTASAAIADRANTAITVVAPFTGTDIDADYVVKVADEARKAGAEQARAAFGRAAEAKAAADLAREAADRAHGDAAAAYRAASAASYSTYAAAQSAAEAQQSAADAATDGAAARAAAARAAQADAQSHVDAAAARHAANVAADDAAIAGRAADAAEQDAAAARQSAASAERAAAAARQSAEDAERSAADAVAAADRAKANADRAAAAAAHARDMAIDIQTAADRAEQQQRREAAEHRRYEAQQTAACLADIPEEDLATLLWEEEGVAAQTEHDQIKAQCSNGGDFLAFIAEIGAGVLLEVLGVNDAIRCFGEGDIGACLWTLVDAASFVLLVTKAVPIGEAIVAVISNIGKYFAKSERIQKIKNKVTELLGRLRGNPACPVMEPASLAAGGEPVGDPAIGATAAAGKKKCWGAGQAEYTSKTHRTIRNIHLDSENPPGRDGQIHLQVEHGNGKNSKYYWDFEKRRFDDIPKDVWKEIRANWQDWKNALNNALQALGQRPVK